MENNLILDQWCVIEKEFHPHKQHHRETIFTIGNGYLSTRGSFEERFPGDRQATLVHGVWDDVPIVFTELANTPDWTSLEIWINDRPFNLKEGSYSGYQRSLNLQSGILSRKLFWSPENQNHIICLEFERFSSLADQHILVSSLKITPKNGNIRARARASLNSLVENEGILHWNCIYQDSDHHHANLLVETRKTKKLLAMSASLSTEGGIVEKSASDCCGSPGIEIKSFLQEGETLTIYKYVGIATSRDTEEPIQLAKEKATLAFHTGYKELKNANLESWDHFWQTSDVIIDGDKVAQTAIRHALFQLRIAAPSCDERVSIGAKTLSGFGYRGHVFWDTEIFILPFFILTQPEISRNLLMYRYHTLSGARRKAAENGYKGAQYSWESAETGDEVTPTWVPDFHNPLRLIRIWTGDIELHISADIVYALHQYWKMTGDDEFWIEVGIPILLETSLFYGERVEFERDHYSIRDIIGPDEYHEHIDNNVYTNRMIQWQLKLAQEALDWVKINDLNQYQHLKQEIGLTDETINHWEDVRENLVILHDPITGLFEQFEGFFDLETVDWSAHNNRRKSMQEILGIKGANEHQVIKQADVIMLLCLLRDEYDTKTWQANWNYYNPITDHTYGSSLGPSIHAWASCEMGQPENAYEHFMLAARADLMDIRNNANDGIHAASAGGLWQAIVFGFAGLNFKNAKPVLSPRLPPQWRSISFKFYYQNQLYIVDIDHHSARIRSI